jgi:hypothetical protein
MPPIVFVIADHLEVRTSIQAGARTVNAKAAITTIGPTIREKCISEHFHVDGPSLPGFAPSYNIPHIACASTSRVSKTPRSLSISRQTAPMFSNVRRSFQNDFL